MEWIPVSERLPEPHRAVLVYGSDNLLGEWGMAVCEYDPRFETCKWHPCHVGGFEWEFDLRTITHWAPLPEPPQ